MSILRFAQFEFDPRSGDLLNGEQSVRLRPKTARLLSHFLEHPQTPLGRDEIFEAVWPDRIVTDNTLMQSVRELRAALNDQAIAPSYVETVHGVGYRWIGPEAIKTGRTASTPEAFKPAGWAIPAITTGAVALLLVAALWLLFANTQHGSSDPDIQRAQIARAQGDAELARRYYEAALIRSPELGAARVGLATMLYETGDWDQAWNLASEPIPGSEVEPDRDALALELIAGRIALARGQLTAAERHFRSVRDRSNRDAVPVIHAAALNGLSNVHADQGRIIDYLAVRAEAVDPMLVSAQVEAFAEGLLSSGSMVHPSFDENWNLVRLQRALILFEEIGDVGGIARTHAALGSNLALDETAREHHLNTAMALYRSSGNLPGQISVLTRLASFEIDRFNADAASDYAAQGQALTDALGAPRLRADFTYRQALAMMVAAQDLPAGQRSEKIETAIAMFETAAREYASSGVVLDGLAPQLHAAIARLDNGDPAQAATDFETLVAAYHDLPFPPGEFGARLGLAIARARLGDDDTATLLLSGLEDEVPHAAMIVQAARELARNQPDADSASSLFALIMAAERQLADTGRAAN